MAYFPFELLSGSVQPARTRRITTWLLAWMRRPLPAASTIPRSETTTRVMFIMSMPVPPAACSLKSSTVSSGPAPRRVKSVRLLISSGSVSVKVPAARQTVSPSTASINAVWMAV
ncbi:MAG: hypothetical protein M5U28_32195 [Sandaracinaceae bacterium]|nr:hypothetical protein [Sandaracinaceae bacterium]